MRDLLNSLVEEIGIELKIAPRRRSQTKPSSPQTAAKSSVTRIWKQTNMGRFAFKHYLKPTKRHDRDDDDDNDN